MELKEYFLDTYALCELLFGNMEYQQLLQGAQVSTTRLNLMEFHYAALLRHGKEAADKAYDAFLPMAREVPDDVVKEANLLKAQLKRRNVSYIDCVGYTLAQKLGIAFLTGDKEFKDLPNVKFVK